MKTRTAFAAAALAMIAQPCFAAQDLWASQNLDRRSAAFAGLSMRLPLGQRTPAVPTARLNLGMAYHLADASGATYVRAQAQGLELGFDQAKPRLYLGGRDMADIKKRLAFDGSTGDVLLIVGGVVAAAGAAFLIFGDFGSDGCIPEDPDCD